jgi:hypothetical protein
MRSLVLAAVLLACGCSSPRESPGGGVAEAGDDSSGAGGDSSGPGGDSGSTTIDVARSHGAWQADQDVNLTGNGSGALGAISIAHGVGTITFQGTPVDAFYFTGSAVPLGTDAGPDSSLAQERDLEIVAVAPDRIILAWITCYEGDLAYVYYETTDGVASSKSQPASGTCAVTGSPYAEAVSLPALSMPAPALVSGFTITGPQLSFDGASAGQSSFDGATWAMYPFHVIDCTACASPGWYELHSIFWSASQGAACAGILYLQESSPSQVELAYLICLPSLTSPISSDQLFFASSWAKG